MAKNSIFLFKERVEEVSIQLEDNKNIKITSNYDASSFPTSPTGILTLIDTEYGFLRIIVHKNVRTEERPMFSSKNIPLSFAYIPLHRVVSIK